MRLNKTILPALLFFISVNCFAQEKNEAEITNVTKITFLSPGVSYEMRIAKNQSIYSQGFMGISGGIGYSSNLGTTSYFHLDPALTLQYRYYYDLLKRENKGKRTEMNSANYISPVFETIFYKDRDYDEQFTINTVGVVWGLQRNYRSRFSLDLNFGIGCRFTKEILLDENGQAFTKM